MSDSNEPIDSRGSESESPGEADALTPDTVTPDTVTPDTVTPDTVTPDIGAKPKRRRWRRWLAILLVVAVVLRIGLAIGARVALSSFAASYGLDARWERLEIALLGGYVELWHLDLEEKREGDAKSKASDPKNSTADAKSTSGVEQKRPLVHVEYVQLDVDMTALLFASLRVHRVEVDGADVLIERDEQGLRLLRRLAAADAETEDPDETEAATEEANDEPFDFSLPLRLDAFRAQHVQLAYRDLRGEATRALDFEANVRLSDLGAERRTPRLELSVLAPGALDSLTCDVEIEASRERLGLDIDGRLGGLRPRESNVQALLAELGIAPLAREISANFGGRVELWATGDERKQLDAKVELHAALESDAKAAAQLGKLAVELRGTRRDGGGELQVDLRDAHARVQPLANGVYAFAGLALVPAEWLVGRSRPWTPSLDAALPPLELGIARASLGQLALDGTAPADFVVEFALPEVAESARLDGTLRLGERVTTSGKLSASGVTLARVSPFLRGVGLERRLQAGRLSLAFDAEVEARGHGAAAKASLSDVTWSDDEELLALGRVAVDGVLVEPDKMRVAELRIEGLRGVVRREKSGVFALLGLVQTVAPELETVEEALLDAEGEAERAAAQRAAAEAGKRKAVAAKGDAAKAGADDAPAPRFELGKLVVRDCSVALVDESVQPAQRLELAEITASAEELVIDRRAKSSGKLAISCASPGLFGKLGISGELEGQGSELGIALALRGDGFDLRPLAPWLAPLGIDPVASDASLSARVTASANDKKAKLALENLTWKAGETELAGLDALRVEGVTLSGPARVASVVVERPRLLATRDASGRVGALGFRLGEAPSGESQSAKSAARPPAGSHTGKPTAKSSARAVSREPEAAKSIARAPSSDSRSTKGPAPARAQISEPAFVLDSLRIVDAQVQWRDEALAPSFDTKLAVDASLEGFATPSDKAAKLDLQLRVPEAIDRLTLRGGVAVAERSAAELRIQAQGLRSGEWTRYLPAGVQSVLQEAQLDLQLAASVAPYAKGGEALRCELSKLRFADGQREHLALESLLVDIARHDASTGVLEVAALRSKGLGLRVEQSPAGLEALGFKIAGASSEASKTTRAPRETAGTAASTNPNGPKGQGTRKESRERRADAHASASQSSASQSSASQSSASSAVTSAAMQQPSATTGDTLPYKRIVIDELSLGIDRLDLIEAGAQQPLRTRLRVTAPSQLVVIDAKPEELAPMRLAIDGSIEPIVGAIDIDLSAAPWADEPSVELGLALRGIKGADFAKTLPTIARAIDLRAFEDGSFESKLNAKLAIRRRSPTQFPLDDGFGFEVALAKTALRAKPDGQVLLGVDAVNVAAKRVLPKSGLLHLASVDIKTPRLIGHLDKQAATIGGVRVLMPSAAESSAKADPPRVHEKTAANTVEAKSRQAAEGVAAAQASSREPERTTQGSEPATTRGPEQSAKPKPPSGEVRIDELTIEGLRVDFEDASVQPALVVPLRELDFVLQRFSTKTFVEPRPFRFAMSLRADPIDLPERVDPGLLGGLLGAVAGAVGGQKDEFKTEKRRLFEELEVQGRLALGPKPLGRVRVALGALELPAFRGQAKAGGVELADGVLDLGVRADLDGAGNARVSSKTTFGHLSLAEPADGPISSYLRLPAPLDTVLFVLRNEDGEQVIPLDISIEDGAVSTSSVAAAGVEALLGLIAKAIAASPFRIVSGIGGAVGLGGDKKEQEAKRPKDGAMRVEFDAGSTRLTRAELMRLEPLLLELASDTTLRVFVEHELGTRDIDQAAKLANPDPQQARALTARLRERRDALRSSRRRNAVDARLQWSLGNRKAAEALAKRVRELDQETALVENELDSVLGLLSKNAARKKAARSKRAAIEIGRRRLESIREFLLASGLTDIADRVEIKRSRFALATEAVAATQRPSEAETSKPSTHTPDAGKSGADKAGASKPDASTPDVPPKSGKDAAVEAQKRVPAKRGRVLIWTKPGI